MAIIRVISMVWLCLLAVSSISAQTGEHIPEYGEILRIERPTAPLWTLSIEHFAFSPDGSQIAAMASEKTVNIWNVRTGEVVRILKHGPVLGVFWSPDGRYLATTEPRSDPSLRMWDVQSGRLLYEIATGSHLSWSPDGSQFATSDLRIFDTATGERQVEFSRTWQAAEYVYWNRNGWLIATTTAWERDDMHLWTRSGIRLDTYWGGPTASWNPDGTLIASGFQVRDITTGLPVVVIPEMNGVIAWHPQGTWIASTFNSRTYSRDTISLWNVANGNLVVSWQFEGCLLGGFMWSADGERFGASCMQEEPTKRNDLMIWERVS
jgi:WD40 repeat protein